MLAEIIKFCYYYFVFFLLYDEATRMVKTSMSPGKKVCILTLFVIDILMMIGLICYTYISKLTYKKTGDAFCKCKFYILTYREYLVVFQRRKYEYNDLGLGYGFSNHCRCQKVVEAKWNQLQHRCDKFHVGAHRHQHLH
jgi:hypothetical protein